MIRVLLADDQALVRAGFRALLESADDISVVAEAQNGGAAVALVRELTPDVVLMDLSMPEVDGLTATGRITADPSLATVKVVVLTTFDDDEHVFAALRAGASGFLVKDIEPEELLQAVRVVARGDALLAPSVTRSLIAAFARQPAQAPAAPGPGAGAGPGGPGAGAGPGAPGAPSGDALRGGAAGGAGLAHRPRARGGGAGRRRAVQRRDRRPAGGQPAHRQDPRQPVHDQARRP